MGQEEAWKRHLALQLGVWTVMVLLSWLWNIRDVGKDAIENALSEGRTYHQLNLAYRKWVTNLGGVYAPVEKVAPNPYLKVPNRDITARDGTRLTLINPAYMTRLVFEIVGRSDKPVYNKLTSLKYLHPANAPDDFERMALISFEKGVGEAREITLIKGEPYLRLIRPFVTEKACLECHAGQGYREGDIRGGISIAVPMAPYYATAGRTRWIVSFTHLLIWLSVGAGIGVVSRRRRRQHEKLEESEWKFRTLLDASQDWVYWYSEDGKVLFSSPSAAAVTGYSAEEFMGNPALIEEVIYPDDRELWARHIADLRAPEHNEIQLRIVTREGDIRWISHICGPISYKGRFLGRRASNRDVTERIIAEEKLHSAYQRLELVFENTHILIAVMDSEFNFLRVNRAYADADGKEPAFFPGKNHFELYPNIENEKIFKQVVETGESVFFFAKPFEYEGHPERGMTYWDWSLLPIKDGTGKVTGLLLTLLDVTEREKAEEQRIKLQQQLQQAQKMEAIGQLTAGISHDFNNILTAIIGYGTLLQMKMDPSDALRPNVDHILESAERAAGLTQGLLAFSRKQVMNPRPADINEVIRKVQKLLSRIIGEDIELLVRPAGEPLNAMVDIGQLEQVLMNLASNARDAMPKGGRLSIATALARLDDTFITSHGYGEPGRYALVIISDTGTGMDKEVRRRIFEPFFTTKEPGKGTGLGLAMAYGIIKQHNGYIDVYSEKGAGTTFKIYLPLTKAAEGPAADRSIEEWEPRGGTETLLLAEDDSTVRRMTETVLTDFGYRVICAEDGEDAVRKFEEHKDDIRLVILDMIMPKKSGADVRRELLGIRPETKVILCSGYSPDVIGKSFVFEKGQDFILKPVSPRDLLRKVREALDR